MPKASDDVQAKSSPYAQRVFSILSDVDCVKILDMIYERQQPKLKDLGTRKRYYESMAKLTKAQLITKRKKSGIEQQLQQQKQRQQSTANEYEYGYEFTDLGLSVYGILMLLRRAEDLHMKLDAIDALDENMPHEELNKLIEKLVPDESIRKILLKDRRRLITKLNSIYSR
jgi:hypothetical protein